MGKKWYDKLGSLIKKGVEELSYDNQLQRMTKREKQEEQYYRACSHRIVAELHCKIVESPNFQQIYTAAILQDVFGRHFQFLLSGSCNGRQESNQAIQRVEDMIEGRIGHISELLRNKVIDAQTAQDMVHDTRAQAERMIYQSSKNGGNGGLLGDEVD